MKRILAITAALILVSSLAVFAELTIHAEVDKTELTTEETLTYKVSITSVGNETLFPEIPEFENFLVLSQMQSTQLSFGGAQAEKTFVYSFVLRPKKDGELTIKPAVIRVGDQEYSSDSFSINVSPGQTQAPEVMPETGQPRITL